MTATDRLRAMLDERGVEWTASGTDTCWTSADGYPMRAWDTTNGTHMRVADLTPEQAITATLGAGTCERVRDDVSGLDVPHNGWYVCSKCGEPLPIMNRYCGGCGAIVRKLDA